MQHFKCEKCNINFGTLKCKDKRCGKCCLDNDYDSEMEYNGEIIEDLTEIICKTMWMPNDLVDLIVEYIDNSPICGVCKYYCESVPHCCKNCNKYMCNDCLKYVFKKCPNTDCYYCRLGICFNNRFEEYCKYCYPLFVIK